jgi:nucleoid DNA-binding protein
MNFTISYHAGERFLQRVLGVTKYTKKDIFYAIQLISNDIKNIVTNRKRFILPSFPKFNVVVKDKTIVTIIKK